MSDHTNKVPWPWHSLKHHKGCKININNVCDIDVENIPVEFLKDPIIP